MSTDMQTQQTETESPDAKTTHEMTLEDIEEPAESETFYDPLEERFLMYDRAEGGFLYFVAINGETETPHQRRFTYKEWADELAPRLEDVEMEDDDAH